MTSPSESYRPAHGGYPTRRRIYRTIKLPRGALTIHAAPPPVQGFGPGHLQEAYELGKRDGRSGR